jgi:nucleotide-binding universal stress UspA family protein
MNERMKVMIAYDGSRYADAAIEDLRRAGLPPTTEALVVSVVTEATLKPAVSEFDLFSLASRRAEAVLSRVESARRRAVKQNKDLAAKATKRLCRLFPDWRVESEVLHGAAAAELLAEAAEWKPDLIVVGSHGRSALGRFFLGSVSKRIAEEAECSVRVVRGENVKTGDEPAEIIAVARDSNEAERIIETIGARFRSCETNMRLIAAGDDVPLRFVSSAYAAAASSNSRFAASIGARGIRLSVEVKTGDLKTVLLETAKYRRSDSIFIAEGDDPESEEAVRGLIANAPCTVEIVR